MKYHLIESYIYEIHAATEEHARELFQQYQEANTAEEEEATEVEFLDNQIELERVN